MKLTPSESSRAPVTGARLGSHELTQNPDEQIKKVEEPEAEMLLRTATEVLAGVDLAVAHYRKRARQLDAP